MQEQTTMTARNEIELKRGAKEVLSVADVQRIMNIGRSQAYELCHSGKFHTVRVGSRIIVSAKSFMKWLHGDIEEQGGN